MDRRGFLALAAGGLASSWGKGLSSKAVPGPPRSVADTEFLDDLQVRSLGYFCEKSDPHTGLILDRARSDGAPYTLDQRPTANITVTGFGLAAFAVAAARGWMSRREARDRVLAAARFFARDAPHERGWFYHWLHLREGTRAAALWRGTNPSEVSTVDTAFLLGGILTARRFFAEDGEIAGLADEIYRRIDFPWMLDPDSHLLRHGWTPENGYIPHHWEEYSEANLLYLLAIGSPAHPIPPECWYIWRRNPNVYPPYRFIGTAPLFIHQYSHAFVDFRGRKESGGTGIDWFENSVVATRAHRQFCLDLGRRFPGYTDDVWGITSSRSPSGYTDWGGPPLDPRIDGTVVPSAAGGSVMFTPDICLPALRAMRDRFGAKIYGRFGFTDSFNPNTGWVSPDITGLNLGITLLAAENLQSGRLWTWFMANPEVRRALELAKFKHSPAIR